MRSDEIAEQELIAKGGIHPYPWKIIEWQGGPEHRVLDRNEITVVEGISRPVAKAIVESYNRNPIVILEDDVVY